MIQVLDYLILASVLHFSSDTFTGSVSPVVGMGLKVGDFPFHKMILNCDLFQEDVVVFVCPALPVGGVMMILGNDIAGSKVWADVPLLVRVTRAPPPSLMRVRQSFQDMWCDSC